MLFRSCRRAFLTLACAASAFSVVSAQEQMRPLPPLYHSTWTTREGAPADIHALAQTTDGFLWLGTSAGLYRFDGIRFELFEPAAHQALPSANISTLFALRDGGLYVGYSFGGASLIQRGAIRTYGEGDGLPPGTVWTFAADSDGTIWVGARGGLARLDQQRWHGVGPEEKLAGVGVTSILVDRTKRLWVASSIGVFARSSDAARFDRIEAPPPGFSQAMLNRSQTWLREASDGAIWASSYELGLRELARPMEGRPERESWPRVPQTEAMLVDRGGAMWVAGASGIQRFSVHPPGTPRMLGKPQQLTQQKGFSRVVRALLEDREGNVWAATSEGLDQFRRAKLVRVDLPGLPGGFAVAPADSGAVWVASYGRTVRIARPGETGSGRAGSRTRESPTLAEDVEVAYRDRAGAVWLGGPRGLWRSARGRFVRVDLSDVKNFGVQAITQDGSGRMWISVIQNAVYRMTATGWTPFGDQPGLPREPATVMTTDETGRTWFGYKANRVALLEGDSLRMYTANDGLNVGNVLAIHVRGSHVWVGGELGLALLVRGHFHPMTGKNGLGFRGTSGIVETLDGEVWLHGAIGVTRIPGVEVRRAEHDSTYQLENELLDFRDGLNGLAAQIRPLPTVIAATDGRLWFATSTDVAWLDPAAIPRNPLPPPVVIRRLTVGSTIYPIAAKLDLPVRTTAVRIDYTALSLSIPERVRFRYQLVGTDTSWQEAGGRREAFYTNLGPGSYRFMVIAANEDGVWNQVGAAFDFAIPPSFTQTNWFLAVWVTAIAGLVWLVYLARVRQVAGALRARYQAALSERTRIAQELHDTLLQGFTGITLQLSAIDRVLAQRPQESAEALKSVLAMADTTLRDARLMIWDMRAVELESQDLAAALESAARSLMTGSSIALVFSVRGDRRPLPVAVETTALRIGREAVINAVKHAAPHTVEVHLEYGPRSLTLKVADDGIGIDPDSMEAAVGAGHFGVAGMRDRARRAGGTVSISSEPGKGAVVSASLPIRAAGNAIDHGV